MKFSKDELYTLHSGLVHYVAHKFTNYAHDYDELVQEGMVGLVKAYNSFDWDRNVKFATYASMCITNDILMYLRRRKKHSCVISYDTVAYAASDGTEELYLVDMLGSDQDYTRVLVQEFVDSLEERDKLILRLTLQHVHQSEIGKILGVSQSYVSRLVYRLGHYYKKAQRPPHNKIGRPRKATV